MLQAPSEVNSEMRTGTLFLKVSSELCVGSEVCVVICGELFVGVDGICVLCGGLLIIDHQNSRNSTRHLPRQAQLWRRREFQERTSEHWWLLKIS
jgi:hypothetical protein